VDESTSDVFSDSQNAWTFEPKSIDQLKTELSTIPKDSRFVGKCLSQNHDPRSERVSGVKNLPGCAEHDSL
jgi:hypothetical protein